MFKIKNAVSIQNKKLNQIIKHLQRNCKKKLFFGWILSIKTCKKKSRIWLSPSTNIKRGKTLNTFFCLARNQFLVIWKMVSQDTFIKIIS